MSDLEDSLRDDAAFELREIAETVMPFGRFSGFLIYRLPAEYLQYFATRGWPAGRLGELLQIVYQMKADGGDAIFEVLRERSGDQRPMRKPRRREYNL